MSSAAPTTLARASHKAKKKALVLPGLIAEASSPSTSSRRLRALARYPRSEVRRRVALNPAAPASLLARLAVDPDLDVRRGVARNPSSPAALLGALARDRSRLVRWEVADNASAPDAALQSLAQGPQDRACFAARAALQARARHEPPSLRAA